MEKIRIKQSLLVIAASLMLPAALLAQEEGKNKDKEKEVKERHAGDQIIITKKEDNKDKVVVEINGDKVTINGKPIDEYKNTDGGVTVRRYKSSDNELFYAPRNGRTGAWGFSGNDMKDWGLFTADTNRAMLGVTTEKVDGGVKINDVTKESAAEKMGLKEGDVITKIDDAKIEDPDGLSKVVRDHKPGDKVNVTFQRDSKEQKASGELGKWKGMKYTAFSPGQGFSMDLGDLRMENVLPRMNLNEMSNVYKGQNWSWSSGSPKLGLSVQDTDDGKGVKVLEVDENSSAAKAGVKENDVITEIDGKAVNSTDEVVRMIRENREKKAMSFKINRGGKIQTIEVNMPRKIKTADL